MSARRGREALAGRRRRRDGGLSRRTPPPALAADLPFRAPEALGRTADSTPPPAHTGARGGRSARGRSPLAPRRRRRAAGLAGGRGFGPAQRDRASPARALERAARRRDAGHPR